MAKKYFIGTAAADWSVVGNWSTGALPAIGDDAIIENNAFALNAGLGQGAIALASLRIPLTYTGLLGVAGHAGAYLAIGAARALLGEPGRNAAPGNGSQMLKIDFGSTGACDCLVYNTAGQGNESGMEPLRILGSHAGHKLTVLNGRVGVGTTNPAETATWPTIALAGGALGLGAGVTWTSLYQTGGTLELASGGTTLVQAAGALTTRGTGVITTLTVGGSATLLGRKGAAGATIVTLEILPGGSVDFGTEPVEVTTLKLHKGARYLFSRANPGMLTVGTIQYLGGAGEVGMG